jgi:cell wall-associated NlpC family hydrolase
MSAGAPLRGEEGNATVTAVGCIVLIAVFALFTADVGIYLSARGRAKDAADASALAAVQESFPLFATGTGPRAAAERYARSNGASLDDIEVSRGGERVEVEVYTEPGSLLLDKLGAWPRKVSARSAAEIDMEALVASGATWYMGDPAVLDALRTLIDSGRAPDFQGAATLIALLSLTHLGKPYVWGATGPNAFDCSGLVCYVYAQVGVRLPRVTFSQVLCGRAVAPGDLVAGDLVFFRRNNHVGIYLGGGYFVHAPRTGDVVKVTPLSARSDISACRRIL